MKESRKTRYTRRALKDSLIELLEEKPITKITVKELCETADINRTTCYAHYANPYDLLNAIEDETLLWANEKISRLGNSNHKETIQVIEEIFTYLLENSNHIEVLLSERGDIGFQKKLFELIYTVCNLTPPPAVREIDDELREYYLVFAVSGSIGLIQKWLKEGLNKSAGEMAKIIYSMTRVIR
jgi:AcrR family transcriptional regulator